MIGDGGRSKRYLIVAVVLLSLVALGPAVAQSDGPDESTPGGEEEFAIAQSEGRAHTVAPDPDSTMSIWPYTSRTKSVDSATLPINMVVLADADLVRSTLIHRPDARWEDQRQGLNASNARNDTDGTVDAGGNESATDGNESANVLNESTGTQLIPTAANATGVYWSEATGSKRYTYIRSGEPGSGRWIEETDQLHDGDYFGTRYHIRFYEAPDGENTWTALQVHREHFDWFRLRHTVGSLPRAQYYVESQFYDEWYIAELQKKRFTNGGTLNSDGWATIVDIKYPDLLRQEFEAMSLVPGLVVGIVGAVGGWTSSLGRRKFRELAETGPVDPRIVVLALPVAAIPLLVRVGSIAVEHSGLVNSPKVVAATFYPILAIGPPICAYVLARDLDPTEAFVAAFFALGVGFLADYSYLAITSLPIGVIVHRAFLLVAIGVVASAGAERSDVTTVRNPTLVVGAFLWIGGLLWALFLW